MVDRQFSEVELHDIATAKLLVEQINQSLRIANKSKSRPTRDSRVNVAEEKLSMLIAIADRHSFLSVTSLNEVRASIETIKRETEERYPLRAAAGQRLDDSWGDLIKGYRFNATLQLRTPLYVLKRHGAMHTDPRKPLPKYAREPWQGIWTAVTKTWKELGGADIPEFVSSSVATDLGPMDDRGDAYFSFLLAVRTIAADKTLPVSQRRALIGEVCEQPQWKDFASAHGGPEAVAMKVL
jgi:hypothetical protein